MRRLSFISLILLVGAAAPQRALAQAGTPPPTQKPTPTGQRRHSRPPAPAAAAGRESPGQPVRADRPGALHRRPRDQHRRRPGALSALPGRPRRAALLRLPLFVRAARRRLHVRRARQQRRLARSGVLRRVQPRRQDVGDRELAADPAVLQRGHDDALYGQRRHAGARRRGAARRPGWSGPQRLPPDRTAVRSARAARHRARRASWPRRRRTSTSRPASPRRSTAASCRSAPASASATTSRWRCPTIRAPTTSPSAPSGPTRRACCGSAYSGSWFDNLADPLVWDSPLRSDDSAGPRAAAACRCGRRTRRRRSASAATPSWRAHAAHRLLLLRPVEQRRAAAAVHDQFGGAGDGPAARQRRRRGAGVLDNLEPDVSPHAPTGDSRRASQLHLRQRDAGDEPSSELRRLRRQSVDRPPPAVPISMPTTGRPFDADATWSGMTPLALTVGYTHNGSGYDARIVQSSGENVFRVSADAVGLPGPPSACNTRSAAAPDRAWTSRPCSISASTRRCGTTTWPTGPGTGSPRRSTSSRRTSGCSACRAGS